jgi:L-ribulose-5-phosphate 3-epimerase
MSNPVPQALLSRRHFLKTSASLIGSAGMVVSLPTFAAGAPAFDFEISLAQWSLHKALFAGDIKALDFPVVARKTYDIGAVEYVNQFFADKAKDQSFLKQLKQRAEDHGVVSSLIMVDGEPEMASTDKAVRLAAIEGHKKWVEAAKYLECTAIRINLHGDGAEAEWIKHSTDSMRALCEFAADFNINILVENHGGFSSSAKLLTDVMRAVDHPRCGTMPDFGNFCVRRRDGDMWESPCVEQYDIYKGVAELMPYAGAVSAKTFDFDEKGNETSIDFRAMLKLVKAANYQGYVGIEYEGKTLSEEAGIRASKKLLETIRAEMA